MVTAVTSAHQQLFKEYDDFVEALGEVLVTAQDEQTWGSAAPLSERRGVAEMTRMLGLYQEQPRSIEGACVVVMKRIVHDTLLPFILRWYERPETVVVNRMAPLFELVYLTSKVRGYKHLIRLFTNSAAEIEPVLGFLGICIDRDRLDEWMTRFVLDLWLTLLAMIPFDLATVDSTGYLLTRWVAAGRYGLGKSGLEMESSAAMIARLMTRKDMRAHLDRFLDWGFDQLNGRNERGSDGHGTADIFLANGVLRTLCHVYKIGDRGLLRPTLGKAYDGLMEFLGKEWVERFKGSVLTRKLAIKAAQRIAMCYLPRVVASWRYLRGTRSLALAMHSDGSAVQASAGMDGDIPHTGSGTAIDENGVGAAIDDAVVPEQVEELLNIVIEGLHDKDTIPRWSAAKGLGRIASRLPRNFGIEVVQELLEMLEANTLHRDKRDLLLAPQAGDSLDLSMTSEHTWHGVCLAMAELVRRGLLLPELLDNTFPWLLRALMYEVNRGNHSVGSNVRDAACYIAWSFARAYDFADPRLREWILPLATTLVNLSIFDREVHVRRAASAAFQEHVGRHGAFPHGIPVLSYTDFYSVGQKPRAYLEVSVEIASKFDEYRRPLLAHAVGRTLFHWHQETRELAAEAVGRLAVTDKQFAVERVIPGLIPKCSSFLVIERHGALLGLGYVLLALGYGTVSELAPPSIIEKIVRIPESLPPRMLMDFDAKLTSLALVKYIDCLVRAAFTMDRDMARKYYQLLSLILARNESEANSAAAATIATLAAVYQPPRDIVEGFVLNCRAESSEATRVGNFLALGSLSPAVGSATDNSAESAECFYDMILGTLVSVFNDLATRQTTTVEMRRNAVESIGRFFSLMPADMGADEHLVIERWASPVSECLRAASRDYTCDHRGDVGSWVRLAVLNSCLDLMRRYPRHLGFQSLGINLALPQAVERLERLRRTSGQIIYWVLHRNPLDPEALPGGGDELKRDLEALRSTALLDEGKCADERTWVSLAFKTLSPLICYPEFRSRILPNWIVAAGGLTEALAYSATDALIDLVETLAPGQDCGAATIDKPVWHYRYHVVDDLIRLFGAFAKVNRVAMPLLEVTSNLLESGVLGHESASVERYTDLSLAVSDLLPMALKSLTNYLGHPIAKVRQAAADNLYFILTLECPADIAKPMQNPASPDESSVSIETLLAETDWLGPPAKHSKCGRLVADLLRQQVGF
ncbi:hypothetical protein EV182_000645 [Spiromyces aspiralis]|uniref:Uncharacterized protein n=1 Tax=Spiromyces aspiralis TaxID=68401 RepID=A0ACC1HH14_9FUNG|nr:hypothetical protein EV182_000645 [Spiromyces aspiralis]